MHAEQRALALRVRVYRLTHAPNQILDFEAKRAGASVTTRITPARNRNSSIATSSSGGKRTCTYFLLKIDARAARRASFVEHRLHRHSRGTQLSTSSVRPMERRKWEK